VIVHLSLPVYKMHGKYRIPTLLKIADQEARTYTILQGNATCGEM
jgi:hypothetical protein